MGQIKNTIRTEHIGFDFTQMLETLCPGTEVEVKYSGTAQITTNGDGGEESCIIVHLCTLTPGGFWTKHRVPVDQTLCSSDWQRLLSFCREAARKAQWADAQEMSVQVTVYDRMPLRAEMSEL